MTPASILAPAFEARGGPSYWLFTGQQRDADSGAGMYYLRARYYDPATGRFLGRDPLPGQQPYAYAQNNPTNRVDPSGRDSETAGIPRACIKLFAGLLLGALAPGLLFTVPVPLFLPLEVMYIYIQTFNATTDLLEAYQEANRTGQAVSSSELAGNLTEALGGNAPLSRLLGLPSLVADFLNCVESRN